ncbi:hypothetical protein L218DRAFT_950863 [Marasmius fiardii PR-910]|nr:hypothetical protein L218DRAFT_950863 [Marasmius fiardii PR-910]
MSSTLQVGTIHDGMPPNDSSSDYQNKELALPSLNDLQPFTAPSELSYHSSSSVSGLEESAAHNREPSAPGFPEFAHSEVPLSSPNELPSTISPDLTHNNILPKRLPTCDIELHSSHPSHEDQGENTSQAPSTPVQHIENSTIGHETFNNLAQGNQFNQYNYTQDLLWDKVAGVGASHNSKLPLPFISDRPVEYVDEHSEPIEDFQEQQATERPLQSESKPRDGSILASLTIRLVDTTPSRGCVGATRYGGFGVGIIGHVRIAVNVWLGIEIRNPGPFGWVKDPSDRVGRHTSECLRSKLLLKRLLCHFAVEGIFSGAGTDLSGYQRALA